MGDCFPFIVAVLSVLLLAAMPWNRPHPNHLFILNLLDLAIAEEPRMFQRQNPSPHRVGMFRGTRHHSLRDGLCG